MGRGEGNATATMALQGGRETLRRRSEARPAPLSPALQDSYSEIDRVYDMIRDGEGAELYASGEDPVFGGETFGHYLADRSLLLAVTKDQLSTGTVFEDEIVTSYRACRSGREKPPRRIDGWAWKDSNPGSTGADVFLLTQPPSNELAALIRSDAISFRDGEPRRIDIDASGNETDAQLPARIRTELAKKVERAQCKTNYAPLESFDFFRFELLHRISKDDVLSSSKTLSESDREKAIRVFSTALGRAAEHGRFITGNHKPAMNGSQQRTDVEISVGELDHKILDEHLREIRKQLVSGKGLDELNAEGPYQYKKTAGSLQVLLTDADEEGTHNVLAFDLAGQLSVRASLDLIEEHQRFSHVCPDSVRERMIEASAAREQQLLRQEQRRKGMRFRGKIPARWARSQTVSEPVPVPA